MRQYLSKLKSVSRKLLDGDKVLDGGVGSIADRGLQDGLATEKPFMLPTEYGSVPLSFRRGTADTLLVSFHGAVDRAKRKRPFFQPHYPLARPAAHQLAISDPTMLLEGEFGAGWYAGHEGFDTQAAIRQIVTDCMRILRVQQVIFMGGSAGGFAALQASLDFDDSYAVVAGAQTNLDRYSVARKPDYRSVAWPSLPPKAPLAEVTRANLCKLYDRPMTNNIVMIYSAGDRAHIERQMLPFAATMARHPSDRFVLECGFWGVEGHSMAVPPMLLNDWLRAITRNPGASPTSLLPFVYELRVSRGAAKPEPNPYVIADDVIADDPRATKPVAAAPAAAPAPNAAPAFPQRDVETAARLARLMAGPSRPT